MRSRRLALLLCVAKWEMLSVNVYKTTILSVRQYFFCIDILSLHLFESDKVFTFRAKVIASKIYLLLNQ